MEPQVVKNIKDSWLLAKLKCGDHKGIGSHRFEIAARLGMNQMQVYYDACATKEYGKHECFATIEEKDSDESYTYCYTIKDLLDELNKWYINKTVTLQFSYNVWDKMGVNTIKVENLFEKEFLIK